MAALCFFPCSVGQRRSALGWWVQMLLEQVWGAWCLSVCVQGHVLPQGTPPRLSIEMKDPAPLCFSLSSKLELLLTLAL